MSHLVLAVLIGVTAVVAVTGGLGLRHYLKRATQAEAAPAVPSLVRLLTSDDELREALHRAASFEQSAIDALHVRTSRYEAMLPAAPVTDIGARRPLVVEPAGDHTPHSA